MAAQISIIEQGTPQFWFDAKTGQVLKGAPNNSAAVAIVGYIDEKDTTKAEQLVRNAYAKQDDAILSDYYNGQECAGGYTTRDSKEEKLNDYKNQKSKGTIKDAYPNVPVLTERDVERLKREQHDPRNPKNRESRRVFQAVSWLIVPMPDSFNYTGAICRNAVRQGLLHSLLRHSAEWGQVIRGFQTTLGRISIQNFLKNIGAANPKNATILLNEFELLLQKISDADRETLDDLQMQIYQFMRNNITYANYLGEGVNQAGRQQVYFKVTDIDGKTQVMVVCPSEQLYDPDSEFQDSRQIRTITTVFFMSWEEYCLRIIKKKAGNQYFLVDHLDYLSSLLVLASQHAAMRRFAEHSGFQSAITSTCQHSNVK